MKIHIDTSSEKEKAQAQNVKATGKPDKPSTTKKPASPSSSKGATSGQAQAPAMPTKPPVQPKPIPKGPKKETKAPPDVAAARSRQSQVLKKRTDRETQSTLSGPNRDVDKGPDLGYITYPFM